MVQGYYTLEEAAGILSMAPDKLSQMAQKREIRAFADRGTWRFRTQDVDEMSRRMGAGSDPDFTLADAPPPKKRTSNLDAKPSSRVDAKPSSKVDPPAGGGDIIGFAPSDDNPIIPMDLDESPAPKKRTSGTKDKQPSGEEELFEFELSSEGSMELDLDSEMGYSETAPRPADDEAPIGFQTDDGSSPPTAKFKTSMPARAGKTSIAGQGSKLRKTSIPPEAKQDSGVKLVGMEDAGVPLDEQTMPADSDVKLEETGSLSSGELAMTEEMKIDDLDEELRRAEEAARAGGDAPEAGSPFELSESDLDDVPVAPRKRTSGVKGAPAAEDDEEVSLGDLSPAAGTSGASGINLHLPADTGVNLEKSGNLGGAAGGDEVEFELSLDADSTPAPSSSPGANDSSEFELTLDDSGGLAPLEGDSSSDSTETPSEEKDIFETDDNIPALDEESSSEAVALDDADTDLESSDFEFDATGQEEEAADDSGSQVVALDEDEEVSTATRDEEDELEGVGEVEEEEEEAVGAGVAAAPAPWGALPMIFLLPGVVVMFLLGLMTFELLHGMWGYKQPYKPTGLIIKPIAEMFGAEFPND